MTDGLENSSTDYDAHADRELGTQLRTAAELDVRLPWRRPRQHPRDTQRRRCRWVTRQTTQCAGHTIRTSARKSMHSPGTCHAHAPTRGSAQERAVLSPTPAKADGSIISTQHRILHSPHGRLGARPTVFSDRRRSTDGTSATHCPGVRRSPRTAFTSGDRGIHRGSRSDRSSDRPAPSRSDGLEVRRVRPRSIRMSRPSRRPSRLRGRDSPPAGPRRSRPGRTPPPAGCRAMSPEAAGEPPPAASAVAAQTSATANRQLRGSEDERCTRGLFCRPVPCRSPPFQLAVGRIAAEPERLESAPPSRSSAAPAAVKNTVSSRCLVLDADLRADLVVHALPARPASAASKNLPPVISGDLPRASRDPACTRIVRIPP